MKESLVKPDNYVGTPGRVKEIFGDPYSSEQPEGWLAWLWFLWTGPEPKIEITVRNVYPQVRLSTQAIYKSIVDEVEKLNIPDVKCGPEVLHESGFFSAYRAYLQVRREFSELLVCAALVGNSYLISVRKIDRFPHTKWFHYVILPFLALPAVIGGVFANGILGGVLVLAMSAALDWSVCRYAAHSTATVLSDHLPEVPVIGPLYLRWFRPDTFYRQDVHSVFVTLVNGIINQVISSLEEVQTVRPLPTDLPGPVRRDLHSST